MVRLVIFFYSQCDRKERNHSRHACSDKLLPEDTPGYSLNEPLGIFLR